MNIELKWDRSNDKKVWEKKRKRYLIYPNYMGTPKVQWYNIYYYGEGGFTPKAPRTKIAHYGYNQSEAKIAAQNHADAMAKAREKKYKEDMEERERARPATMLKFRKDNFYVKVYPNINPGKFDFDELYLKVSHNGSQAYIIGFTLDEARQAVVALQRCIDDESEGSEQS